MLNPGATPPLPSPPHPSPTPEGVFTVGENMTATDNLWLCATCVYMVPVPFPPFSAECWCCVSTNPLQQLWAQTTVGRLSAWLGSCSAAPLPPPSGRPMQSGMLISLSRRWREINLQDKNVQHLISIKWQYIGVAVIRYKTALNVFFEQCVLPWWSSCMR